MNTIGPPTTGVVAIFATSASVLVATAVVAVTATAAATHVVECNDGDAVPLRKVHP